MTTENEVVGVGAPAPTSITATPASTASVTTSLPSRTTTVSITLDADVVTEAVEAGVAVMLVGAVLQLLRLHSRLSLGSVLSSG